MREIELKPSRALGLLLAGMVTLALVAVYFAAFPGTVRLLLAAVAISLGGWGWRQSRHVESLRPTADGRLQARDAQGAWRDVEVLGDSLVTTALIVLRYRPCGGRVRSLTLLPDSATPDDLRRLRVSLRWASRTRSDTASPGAG